MIKKDLVRKNFSRGSDTYEDFAVVQKHMAKNLINFIPNDFDGIKILEIGSGTGILTRELLRKFPKTQITLIDISEKMIDRCKKEFGFSLNYIIGDAENYEFSETYDLIISNAAFQWFNDLEKSLESLKQSLSFNGKILFSTFMEGTYKELNDSFLKISGEYNYSQNFINSAELYKLGEVLKTEVYYEEYENLLDFLKSIKAIGAQSSLGNKKVLTKNILNKVEEEYKKSYETIRVSNVLGYIKVNNN